MTKNFLAAAKSPYLLQHADNPVHWRPWGVEALHEAGVSGRPILVSVGYAACHWCHVMAHESFEHVETAMLMNELFVCVKVDREERPDVDQALMASLLALGEQGGWPMTMFLLPDGRPFWGGTYFPLEPRWGRPSFRQVLRAIDAAFRVRDPAVLGNADALAAALSRPAIASDGSVPSTATSIDRIDDALDHARGGLRGAPKFPNAPVFALLWQLGCGNADPRPHAAVRGLLDAVSLGGIHDHLGGGFARYATDAEWLVPHFEKMLYDNAQLLDMLARASISGEDPWFATVADRLVAWLRREMLTEDAFASAIDADSEGAEGQFYVWDPAQLTAALPPDERAGFAEAFDCPPGGNWEGQLVLRRRCRPDMHTDADGSAPAMKRLFGLREMRARPDRDDKILADWNGLVIAALVRAGSVLGRPDWLSLARAADRSLEAKLGQSDGRIAHAWRDGVVMAPGFLSDQGATILSSIALFEACGDVADRRRAEARLEAALHWFVDESGEPCTTARDLSDRTFKPISDGQDGPLPSGPGLLAMAAARWAIMSGDARWEAVVRRLVRSAQRFGASAPLAAPTLLAAADLLDHGLRVDVAGPPESDLTRALWSEALRSSDPRVVVSPPTRDNPASASSATVCGRGLCSVPVITVAALRDLLVERGRRA